jgi:hypothetical protein
MKITNNILSAIVICVTASLQCLFANTQDPKPRVYLSSEDVIQLRRQSGNAELKPVYDNIKSAAQKSLDGWLKKYPPGTQLRSTAQLVEIGLKDNPWRDYKTLATAYALEPNAEYGRVLREKLVASIGARKIKNYWREYGIHEGEAVMQFIEAYDLASSAGLLSKEDELLIKEELNNAAHFLEGWMLDGGAQPTPFSQGYLDYYRTSYCLNFHTFATSVMGTIAMMYPDLPDSKKWIRAAQSEMLTLLYTEFGLDGGYGESSLHYWHPTFRAYLQFFIASKNLGYKDYLQDPSLCDALIRTLNWRLNLTHPDGLDMALGDGFRESVGAEYLILGGRLLNQPSMVWVGRDIIRKSRPNFKPYEPYDAFYYDFECKADIPVNLFANFPYSGYSIFRSDWSKSGNYFMVKYGPTYFGRRENETNLVISGHAHADTLNFELHYKGIPYLTDNGTVGWYSNWNTYGGFCKATISHNTVGIGNEWGYDRLDGKYLEHVEKHGTEFLYETSQNNIARSDIELKAIGDTGEMAMFSARVKTYDSISQQRTTVWFRDIGLTVVADNLTSDRKHFYEWYLNPIGDLIQDSSVITFGDEEAKLDIISILPKQINKQIIRKGSVNLPPYYISFKKEENADTAAKNNTKATNRWQNRSLLVIRKEAMQANFLNIIVPYTNKTPYELNSKEDNVRILNFGPSEILVAGPNNSKVIQVDGEFAVVRSKNNAVTSYALSRGADLVFNDSVLLNIKLLSTEWKSLYNNAVTAAVSIKDKRATFSFNSNPMDRRLIMFSPKIEIGKEPALPIVNQVTFKVAARPTKIIALRSVTEMPELIDESFDKQTKPWYNDPHANRYLREELKFDYNASAQLVTIKLDVGVRQIIWE